MPEIAPHQTGIVDPSLTGGNISNSPELTIRFNTFEEAQAAEDEVTDSFVDDCIEDTLRVGSQEVGIKGYLDKVESTAKDERIISDPEAIAALYLTTTEMVSRNLKVVGKKNATAERQTTVKGALESFKEGLHSEASNTADKIVAYCEGRREKSPRREMGYDGLKVDGIDILDSEAKSPPDFRPNIKIQRQAGGTFIMGYSDKRVQEKLKGEDEHPAKRIYLNPDPESSPQIFEQVLQAANEAGLSIQLKMLQRSQEFAWANRARSQGQAFDALRGDGVVIYASEAEANDVLSMVLALAKDQPEAFIGRQTSKIPQGIAEGIAIGDEPTQAKSESLTSHRMQMFNYAAEYVRKSGKTGQEARELFRNRLAAVAKANHADPKNIAFNEATTIETSNTVTGDNNSGTRSKQDTTDELGASPIERIAEQDSNIDEGATNKIFESQAQQFVRSLHERAKAEERELNSDEVQQIRNLVQIVQQRRGIATQETGKPMPVQDEKNLVDDDVRYLRGNNIDITTASQRYESQVQQFVEGLRERASNAGRELNADEVRQIKQAVETVNDLRSFAKRAA